MRAVFSSKSHMLNENLELACTLWESAKWGGGGIFNLSLLSLAGSPNLGREFSPAADTMRNNPPTSAGGMVEMAIWWRERLFEQVGQRGIIADQSMDSSVGSCGRHGS